MRGGWRRWNTVPTGSGPVAAPPRSRRLTRRPSGERGGARPERPSSREALRRGSSRDPEGSPAPRRAALAAPSSRVPRPRRRQQPRQPPPARPSDGACSQWAAGRACGGGGGGRANERRGYGKGRAQEALRRPGPLPPPSPRAAPLSTPRCAEPRALTPEGRKGRLPPLRRSSPFPDELVQGNVRHLAPPRSSSDSLTPRARPFGRD